MAAIQSYRRQIFLSDLGLTSPYIRLGVGIKGQTPANALFNILSTFWEIDVIYRPLGGSAHYFCNILLGAQVGTISLIYGFNNSQAELYIDDSGANNKRIAFPRTAPGTAHRYQVKYNGTTLQLLLDNEVTSTTTISPLMFGTGVNPCFVIGGQYTGDYNKVRFYKSGFLVVEYLFPETSGLTAFDSSGNGVDLTLSSGVIRF